MNSIDASSDADPLVELADQYADRFRRGERPSLTEYTDQHPDLADRIRKLFPTLVVMEEFGSVAEPSTDPYSTSGGANVPRQLGDYRILRIVGHGGMGVVYEAVQESLGRHVALKVLPVQNWKNPIHLERFRREARAVARLHHTNIVPVFGVGQVDDTHFYAMQFIQGQSLDNVLQELKHLRRKHSAKRDDPANGIPRDAGLHDQTLNASIARGLLSGKYPDSEETPAAFDASPMPSTVAFTTPATPPFTSWGGDGRQETRTSIPTAEPATRSDLTGEPDTQYYHGVARIGVQVAEALAYAHQKGILHRDVKPGNLLLDTQAVIWLTDFGLAKADDNDELTSAGDIVGTVRYMAPERFKGDADPRSDVYSLGLTLYEMLTLQPAFDSNDRARLIDRITRETPPAPRTLDPAIPRDLETVILKAIAREPSARYATAAALADDLQRYLSDRPIRARRITLAGQTWRWCRRNPAIAGLITAVASLMLVSVIILGVAYDRIRGALAREKHSQDELKQSLYYQWIAAASEARNQNRSARAEELLSRCPPHLRGWEWHYLKRRSFATKLDIKHCQETIVIMRVAFSPDGHMLAIADRDGYVSVYDARRATPILERFPAQTGMTRGLVFSPDSRFLATGGEDDHVNIWNVRGGDREPVRKLRLGRKAVVLALAYRPNGQQIAMSDQHQDIRVWNLDGPDDDPITLASPARLAIRGLEYSANGRQLWSVSTEGVVTVWDVASRTAISLHDAALPGVHAVAYSDDRRFIALGNEHGTVRVIRTDSWERSCPDLSAHTTPVHGLAFGARGRLASSGSDNTIRIWDLSTGQESLNAEFHDHERWNVLAFLPGGKPTGRGGIAGSARVLDGTPVEGPLDGGQTMTMPGHKQPVSWLAYSASGNRFASASWDGTVKIWDARSGQELRTLSGGEWPLTSVAFSDDDQLVAASSLDGTVRIWNAETGREIHPPLNAGPGPVSSVVFGRGGTVLASGHHDGTIGIWDVASGKLRRTLMEAHLHPVQGLAFCPNGEFLTSAGGKDNCAKVWKFDRDPPRVLLLDKCRGIIRNPAYSPEGTQLVAATGGIRTLWLWDVGSGKETTRSARRINTPGSGHVHRAIFHPDGKRLIVISDEQLYLLDPQSEQAPWAVPAPHSGEIKCAALSPDGKYLITGGGYRDYGEIRVWELSRWKMPH